MEETVHGTGDERARIALGKKGRPDSPELYEQISRLARKKKWPRTVVERRSWVDPGDRMLRVRRQCELLGLHRSNVYCEPVPVGEDDLRLMRLIDEEYLERPHLRSREWGLIWPVRGWW